MISVAVFLLLRAQHAEVTTGNVELKPGQAIISLEAIADWTGLSIQQVRTALNRLKSTGEITCRTTNRFTIVDLTNWELWAYDYGNTNTQNNTLTNNQQASNKQSTTNNTLKTLKTLNTPLPPKGGDTAAAAQHRKPSKRAEQQAAEALGEIARSQRRDGTGDESELRS